MKHLGVIIGLIALTFTACQPPQNIDTTALSQTDLSNFTALMNHDFATAAQNTESIILDQRMRVDAKALKGFWLYTQLNTGQDFKLYRQRLNHFTLSSDGQSLIHKAYILNEAAKFENAWENPEIFSSLTEADYTRNFVTDGCEQIWQKTSPNTWHGKVNPKSCKIFSKRRQQHIYIGADASISETQYLTSERGYDETGVQLWGTNEGEMIRLYKRP